MTQTVKLPWFKVDSTGWLIGSIRHDMDAAQRGVWIDLLALASECRERNGKLTFAPGKPMPIDYIASYLRIPVDLLQSTIDICTRDKNKNDNHKRIEILDDGTIMIANYAQYQGANVSNLQRYIAEDARERELRERKTARALTKKFPEEVQDAMIEVENAKSRT